MTPERKYEGRDDYLKRLPPEYYRGRAYVHWSMTIAKRQTGWLTDMSHLRFREILTHTVFRYVQCTAACPTISIFSGWAFSMVRISGRRASTCGRGSTPFWRNPGFRLQQQPYDHVLSEDERQREAFQNVAEYIARNPERAELVEAQRFLDYPYTNCLVPGYPELDLGQEDFWDRFWRIQAYWHENGLIQA